MQTTAAGTRVVTGPDVDRAKEQTAARANAVHEAEQKRGYARRDARNARLANPSTGNANVTSTSQPAQAAPTQTTPQSPKLVRRDRNERVTPTPTVFKGGYAVDTGDNVDWSAKGDGHINISGANFTDEQYAAYNKVRSSLTTAIRQQEGVSLNEARARATALANQWAADQSQVAAGGKAFNRWQHVDAPEPEAATPAAAPAALPVTPSESASPEPTGPAVQAPAGQTSSLSVSPGGSIVPNESTLSAGNKPLTLGGSPDLGISPDVLGAVPPFPANNPLANPVTTSAPSTSTEVNPAQPAAPQSPTAAPPTTPPATPPATPQPAEQAPAPAGTTNNNPATPQQPSNPHKDTVWTQFGITDALNKQKTQVASGLTAIPGYDGLLFRKDGDNTGGVYDRTGKQLTYQGKAINDELLRGDRNGWWELWKDGDYGADILHNAYQAMQSRATSNYGDAEMNALGFTRVPGSRRWYRNAKGQFVDISGELAPTGTIEGQLDHGRTVNQRWRKDTSDPMGLFFDGEREDIGYL